MSFRTGLFCGGTALLTLAAFARPQNTTASLAVHFYGAIAAPQDKTNAALFSEFKADVKTIHYTLKKQRAVAHVVPLLTVLNALKPQTDAKQKHPLLAFAIVVRGTDGYTVTYSMAELQSDFGHHRAYLALDKNGKPLAESEAPVSLIDLDEPKPSRWVHAIRSIQILDTTALPAN